VQQIDPNCGPRYLFTAPWDPVLVRRGDALGLRALADEFSDVVAPGLSNRVRDGRWVTILAWCLVRSQEVFHAGGGRSVVTRAEQRDRYAWLRPLEMMWVARTIALAREDWRKRSLAGQRRIWPWYQNHESSTSRFGMTEDQFRAYRQTGMYGGYRIAFRKWPGMTRGGDGWTPGPKTDELATWLDKKLGAARPAQADDDNEDSLSGRSVKLNRGKEDLWWFRHWATFDEGGKNADENTLPRRKTDYAILPERHLLKPLIFGSDRFGIRRLAVANEIAKSGAIDHIGICEHLASVFDGDRTLAVLPHFSRLADAGMAAMELIARGMMRDGSVALADIASLSSAKPVCNDLMAAAKEWRDKAAMQIRHIEAAHRFANAIPSARPIECLGALLHYHERYGGGLRWFVLRNGRVEPRTPSRSGSSDYRFRLWSLCRLAVQCGVMGNMPSPLRGEDEAQEAETSGDANE
jgi:hypothetical protein